ncbi:MAG: hypothetical protein ABII26_00295 [Pseudomonadota bacterium]
MIMRSIWIAGLILLLYGMVEAKVDLVTLPKRDRVQLTIYNSADLTLVRESRALTLRKGLNHLQFSWANTLIDPTSLEMVAMENGRDIEVFDLTYPPRISNLGLWRIKSDISGNVPTEITYLTSGLSWRAFYMGTLSFDEKTMHLNGYIRATNHSGEDYENAQVRLIVGKIHILDEIADLARRKYPYGRPGPEPAPPPSPRAQDALKAKRILVEVERIALMEKKEIKPKEIKRKGSVSTSSIPSKAPRPFQMDGRSDCPAFKWSMSRS